MIIKTTAFKNDVCYHNMRTHGRLLFYGQKLIVFMVFNVMPQAYVDLANFGVAG